MENLEYKSALLERETDYSAIDRLGSLLDLLQKMGLNTDKLTVTEGVSLMNSVRENLHAQMEKNPEMRDKLMCS